MEYKIISTGSKGNALLFFNNGVPEILVDCGVEFKKINEIYKKLKLVCLTHIHGDHFKKTTIKKLAIERPTLRFACCKWLVNDLINCGVNIKNIDVLNIGKWYKYDICSVSPILLYHNVPQCGYRLIINGKKIIYATDTNTMEGIEAKNYDYYFIECNHTEEEINARIEAKKNLGLYCYEYEAKYNHLSKEKCDNFLFSNMGKNSYYTYMHQHERKEDEK